MLETPDTADQLITAFNEFKDVFYVQCHLFNCLVGVALVILCCLIFAYIVIS